MSVKRASSPDTEEGFNAKKRRINEDVVLSLHKSYPPNRQEGIDEISQDITDQFLGEDSRIHSFILAMSKPTASKPPKEYKVKKVNIITAHNKETKPLFAPVRKPWRLAVTLDDLAALLVSKPHGERIALSLRVHDLPETLELFIAGSGPVEEGTVQRLVKIWTDLGHLSAGCFKPHRIMVGTSKIRRKVSTRRLEDFQLDALKWSFAKIRKRVNSRPYHDIANATPAQDAIHPFSKVRNAIDELKRLYTHEHAVFGEPADHMKDGWEHIWDLLNIVREEGRHCKEPSVTLPSSQRKYLRKVGDFVEQVKRLTKAAKATNLAYLFRHKIRVTVLNEHHPTDFTGPDTVLAWASVLRRVAQDYNKLVPHKRASLAGSSMDDLLTLATTCSSHVQLAVHPELRMLLHCARANHVGAYVFTYIGLSNPSCWACWRFLTLFNGKFGDKFMVQGSNGKMRWPWKFPSDCPESEIMQDAVYRAFVTDWVPIHPSFCIEPSPDDSTTAIQSTVDMGTIRAGAETAASSLATEQPTG